MTRFTKAKLSTLFRLPWWIASLVFSICFLPILVIAALVARGMPPGDLSKPRLVWGSTPILNNVYWSRAMRLAGYDSETFTTLPYLTIDKRDHWDRVIDEQYRWAWRFRPYVSFLTSLFRYDIFFIPATGFFLGSTPLWKFQHTFFHLAGKKVVFLPYGSDSYVYGRVRSLSLIHGLLSSYPQPARQQIDVARRLDYWIRNADVVVPGFMGGDGFGRWDVLIPSPLFLDLEQWTTSLRFNDSDGSSDPVVVAHAPNHRGFKGTGYIVEAVRNLQEQGLNVKLKLLEGMQNDEIRRILREEVDILVEQLIFPGHGLNGLEGMASGLPVISNLEEDDLLRVFRRHSYFDKCPIISANPESVEQALRVLVSDPFLRRSLSVASRKYVEDFHGLESAQFLFGAIIKYLRGDIPTLLDLYDPLSKKDAMASHLRRPSSEKSTSS